MENYDYDIRTTSTASYFLQLLQILTQNGRRPSHGPAAACNPMYKWNCLAKVQVLRTVFLSQYHVAAIELNNCRFRCRINTTKYFVLRTVLDYSGTRQRFSPSLIGVLPQSPTSALIKHELTSSTNSFEPSILSVILRISGGICFLLFTFLLPFSSFPSLSPLLPQKCIAYVKLLSSPYSRHSVLSTRDLPRGTPHLYLGVIIDPALP